MELCSVIVWGPGCSVYKAKGGACSFWRHWSRTHSPLCPGSCCFFYTPGLSYTGWNGACVSASVVSGCSHGGTWHLLSACALSSHEICVSTTPLPFLLYQAAGHTGLRAHCIDKYALISVCTLITTGKANSQIKSCSQAPGSEGINAPFGGETI